MAVTNKKSISPTQKYLQIAEIRENIVIMNDGSMLSVLMVSSLNFYLKSEEEQNALIVGYVDFLNSLEFSIQIVIQSRKLNIEGYLAMIKEAEKKQTNELLKMQTADYREFVAELVDLADIMSKKFYVVVPFAPLRKGKKNFFTRLSEVFYPASRVVLKEERFAKNKVELSRRTEQVTSGLSSLGLNLTTLETQSLIELYYNSYNPIVSAKEVMEDVSKINVEI